jgi:D-lactate dehydrogenase
VGDVLLENLMALQAAVPMQTSTELSCGCRAGNYTLSGLIGMELCRKTVGVIGTGAIGACAARIWKASTLLTT